METMLRDVILITGQITFVFGLYLVMLYNLQD